MDSVIKSRKDSVWYVWVPCQLKERQSGMYGFCCQAPTVIPLRAILSYRYLIAVSTRGYSKMDSVGKPWNDKVWYVWIPWSSHGTTKCGIHRLGLLMNKEYYVYILASNQNGTLYVGVTSNLIKRVWQHKNDLADGFTKKYQIHNLVYYEQTNLVEEAIKREKRLKDWKRNWKIELIEKSNPQWIDLYESLI